MTVSSKQFRLTLNQRVVGSSPTSPTNLFNKMQYVLLCDPPWIKSGSPPGRHRQLDTRLHSL